MEQGKLSRQQQQWKPCHFESSSAPSGGGVGPGIHSQEQEVLPGEALQLLINLHTQYLIFWTSLRVLLEWANRKHHLKALDT